MAAGEAYICGGRQSFNREKIMETYLFIALAFIYLLTAFILSKQVQKRIWTVAYILAFAITCVAIFSSSRMRGKR